jgi:hypothetical protein
MATIDSLSRDGGATLAVTPAGVPSIFPEVAAPRWIQWMTISPTITCGCWSGSPRTPRDHSPPLLGRSTWRSYDVERLCADLVDAEMIERGRVQ